MARRIFTIVGRAGTVIVTDSKKNDNDNGALYEYKDANGNTQLCALKALNSILNIIPRPNKAKLDQPVVFLLPKFVEFLRYEDTRKVWVGTGKKKNGEEIEPELLTEVRILDRLITELGSNVQLFGHQGLKSNQFIQYKNATWNILNEKVPAPEPPETISADEAF